MHMASEWWHQMKTITVPLKEIKHNVINTLRPIQNGRNFADDIFKCIFVNENVWILIEISLKFIPKGPINNIPALVQIMAWRRPGDKPLSEAMMVNLPTHICVTRSQWVKQNNHNYLAWSPAASMVFIKMYEILYQSLCISNSIIAKAAYIFRNQNRIYQCIGNGVN